MSPGELVRLKEWRPNKEITGICRALTLLSAKRMRWGNF